MEQTKKSVATWIIIVSGLIALMELMVSVSLFIAPESVIETVDLKAKGVDFLIYMWASRQFALGFIFAFATIRRSIPMLTIAYIFFLVMFLGDLFIGVSQKENALILAAIIMCIISLLMIFALNKKK